MGLLEDKYNTFAGTRNQFGGTSNQFAGRPATIEPTVRQAVTSPQPAQKNPFLNGGPGGSGVDKLAELERKGYKDFHDWYYAQKAAEKAYRQEQYDNPTFDQNGDQVIKKYAWDLDAAPDWLVGRGVELPEDSSFQFSKRSGLTMTSPLKTWQEFREKWKENPDYDMYTGVYHKDYYPQEWIDMARYWDYVAENR